MSQSLRSSSNGPPPAVTVVLLLVSTLTVMAGATISPALPKIQAHFTSAPNAKLLVELLLTIPGAAIALTAPLLGWLSDRIGRRSLITAAIVLYAGAGTSGLWLDALPTLLMGRVFLGVAVGAVLATATALIGDYFEGAEREKVFGWQAAATGFGGVIFLLAGGVLADAGWRGPFAVYGLAALLAPLAFAFLNARPRSSARGNESNNGGPHAALLVVGLAATVGLAGAAFYLVPTQLPFRLFEIGAKSGIASGVAVGVAVLASALASLTADRLASFIKRQYIIALALLLLGIGLLGIGVFRSYVAILAALIVVGTGTGILQPTLNVMALNATSDAVRGRVAGAMTSLMFLGQFCSPFLSFPIEARSDLATAYRLIGVVCSALGLSFGAGAWFVERRRLDGATSTAVS